MSCRIDDFVQVDCIKTAGDLPICPDPLAPDCVCKAPFRAAVASCLSLTCTDAEYLSKKPRKSLIPQFLDVV